MHQNISDRPTRIAELVPLHPSIVGYHDTSGLGAGGAAYPTPDLPTRAGVLQQQPIFYRFQWPSYIMSQLITDANPHGTITNSALELVGEILQLDAICQSYDVQERTIDNKMDNLVTMFW